jgi:hypothetical protein
MGDLNADYRSRGHLTQRTFMFYTGPLSAASAVINFHTMTSARWASLIHCALC